MANSFVNRGEVLTLSSMEVIGAGKPYRVHGFNGIALIDAAPNEAFNLQVRGVFEFPLNDVVAGNIICIDDAGNLIAAGHKPENSPGVLYGRAVTDTDADGNFHCMILQSE